MFFLFRNDIEMLIKILFEINDQLDRIKLIYKLRRRLEKLLLS